jgi:IS30 family transposase
VSIEDRPGIVDDKSRIGDWEIDTVIGKGNSGALVTIVERVTSAQVDSMSAKAVTKTTIMLFKPYKESVLSITADNGKEFACHEEISKALSAELYIAYPYSCWERGLNDNTNGLLRQYFPKSTDFKVVSQAKVKRAVNKLNSRPRKNLGFKNPGVLMAEHRAAVSSLNLDALRILIRA